jgi:transposase
MVQDLTRARNRLTKFLLRHSVVWRDGSNWTGKHRQWLNSVRFDDRALTLTFAHYRSTVELRDSQLTAIEEDLAPYCDSALFGDHVHRLAAYRGVTRMGGLCTGAEVFDWRRFPAARSFMCFTGLVPSEDSSGLSEHRGNITHAGNRHLRAQLVEAVWAYQHRPHVGAGIAARHDGLAPEVIARAWNAQVRLNRRFRNLARRKNVRSVVATAVARELAGFLWAEMTTEPNTN